MSSWTLGNPRSFDILGTPLFDDEECDAIIAAADALAAARNGWSSAAIHSDTDATPRVELETRSVNSVPLPIDPPNRWVLDRLVAGLVEVNDSVYRFELDGIPPSDFPSILRYDGGTADHFRSHRDSGGASSTRRLTFSVQLSDPRSYTGCDLYFSNHGLTAPRDRGSLVSFASSEFHHVTPIMSGQRYAIVGWVHGPASA